MTDAPFKMSQGFEVLPPKSGQAYPIPCEEWDFLKKKVRELSNRPWVLHTIGTTLLGACVSTFITLLMGGISTTAHPNAEIVAWAVIAVTLICGVVCMIFADQQHKVQRVQADDILTQMELVEKRFERRAS